MQGIPLETGWQRVGKKHPCPHYLLLFWGGEQTVNKNTYNTHWFRDKY